MMCFWGSLTFLFAHTIFTGSVPPGFDLYLGTSFILVFFLKTFLPTANEVCEGDVFTPVCHSVHGGRPDPGLEGCIPACIEADTPPPGDGYCCGRYASYWNAFLFLITLKSMRSQCCGQRKSLTVQLNLRPVMRIELYTKVCNVLHNMSTPNKYFKLS